MWLLQLRLKLSDWTTFHSGEKKVSACSLNTVDENSLGQGGVVWGRGVCRARASRPLESSLGTLTQRDELRTTPLLAPLAFGAPPAVTDDGPPT
ncbi:hypothetical protein EVAR_90231_1 [Eumeta japonica]|uniref:Uncharacterized protein n=1 Tax=Eumeta variegata TaxID=151549 RepID=A0A4C1YTE8_EUMVA|nr:hypothetical protein EVAR_90231_1 [Eumeta japonica]